MEKMEMVLAFGMSIVLCYALVAFACVASTDWARINAEIVKMHGAKVERSVASQVGQ